MNDGKLQAIYVHQSFIFLTLFLAALIDFHL